jgi:membrane protein implicated in regulation of membrane protease activity
MSPGDWLVALISSLIAAVIVVVVVTRYLSSSRQTRAQLTSGAEYRALAEEFRRLSDVAITAQEHVDLRLTDLSVQVDSLRDQLDHMQRILKEVE